MPNTDLRRRIALLSQACFDAYGNTDGGFSFDHQISVVRPERVAIEINYKRIEPSTIGDGRRVTYKDRFRFRLSAKHEKVFDLYEMIPTLSKILREQGFTPSMPSGDNENNDRVEIDITAVLDG